MRTRICALFSMHLPYLACLYLTCPALSQAPDYLRTLLVQNIGLENSEVAQLENGRAIAKILDSHKPSQILVFGGVYIAADPGKYLRLANDVKRPKHMPGERTARSFSSPPVTSDLSGFALGAGDVNELKKCKPGDCDLQFPAASIERFRKEINWSAPNPASEVNRLTKEMTLQALLAYQAGGNAALGTYEDKEDPTHVAKQFRSLVESARAFSLDLPTLYSYILNYPRESVPNSSNLFYWEDIDFGLKPTFRVNQQVTVQMNLANRRVDVVAVKQIYATHYFQTALDLYFCFPGASSGFYLVTLNGSEQDGLTGLKGRMVRKLAADKTESAIENYLSATKRRLEH